ncbi:MAG: hypothetical protein KDA87_18510, partial [Planctomycetales bacterium]|nr:hypothetical protein [Planctomycetales bacterium]
MFDHMQPSPVAHRCIIAVFLLWMSGCSDQPRPESPAPNIEPNSHWPQLLDGGPDLDETQVQWFDIRKQLGPRIVTLHPFGEMVVLTTNSETILYHLPSGKRWQSWFLPSTAVQFSGDGTKLLTRRKMDFAIWNLTPFQEVCHFPAKRQTLPHNADEARETAARSGQPVAAINYDGSRIVIFNDRQLFAPEHPTGLLIFSDQGELQRTISLPPDTEVRSLRFVGKDNLLMSELVNRTSEDHRHVIWDIATGRATVEFPGDKSVRICDNGKLVLSAELSVWSPSTMRYPAVIQVRETSSGKLKQTVHAGAPIRDITFNPDGTRIWASLQDRLVEWDLSSGQIVFQVSQQEHPFATVDYSPDGKRRFATIEFPNGLDEDVDHLLRGWDVSTGKKLAISDFAFGSFDGMEELFFYQQGEYFIDLNAPFAVRSVTSGAVLQEAITYHQSQRQIPVRRHPWDVPDWAFQLESFGHGQHDLVVSQDGERAVIKVQFGLQTPQTRVIVVDTARPDEPQILQEYSSMVAIRPDHRRFVTATIDALIERDTDAPEVQTELMKLPGRALFANYNSDGSKLIVGGTSSRLPYQYWLNEDDAGWAAVVDVATQQIVSLVGHQAPVTTGEFAPDDSRSATGSVDRTIRLWGNSGESIYVFQGHRGAINKIAFDPMGTRILSAANDGLASWSMAGVVDPDIEPARFVENF